jgi:hypothetical protein
MRPVRKRWNALRAIYAASGAQSLLDVDLAAQPAHRVATASAKRFKTYLAEVRDRLAGQEPSWRDDVWTRATTCGRARSTGPSSARCRADRRCR